MGKEEPCHSLSSDLGSLIHGEASSDLILEAGERRFRVHRNILAARSPVFASLLTQLEQEMKAKEELKEEEKDEGRGKERRGLGQERIEEAEAEAVTSTAGFLRANIARITKTRPNPVSQQQHRRFTSMKPTNNSSTCKSN